MLRRRVVLVLAEAALVGMLAAQQGPTAASVFGEAKAAAAQLPPPLDVMLLNGIATDEFSRSPKLSLPDFESLFARVHGWPDGDSVDPLSEERETVRDRVEGHAVYYLAQKGRFQEALRYAHQLDDTNPESVTAVYGWIIEAMAAQQDTKLAVQALEQSREQGGFPFAGARAAVQDAKMPKAQRVAIAARGIEAAENATTVAASRNSGLFLAAVHEALPEMDTQVEDAAASVLAGLSVDRGRRPKNAASDQRAGERLLALIEQIDPTRATTLRAQYAGASTSRQMPQLSFHLGDNGQPNQVSYGADTPDAISRLAAKNPRAALKRAAAAAGKGTRFRIYCALALALAGNEPQNARQAASAASALLDKDLLQGETDSAVQLAQAYARLGDTSAATDLAQQCLDAVTARAKEIGEKFPLDSQQGQADAARQLYLATADLSDVYVRAAEVVPAQALADARACPVALLKPMVLADVAKGMPLAKVNKH